MDTGQPDGARGQDVDGQEHTVQDSWHVLERAVIDLMHARGSVKLDSAPMPESPVYFEMFLSLFDEERSDELWAHW